MVFSVFAHLVAHTRELKPFPCDACDLALLSFARFLGAPRCAPCVQPCRQTTAFFFFHAHMNQTPRLVRHAAQVGSKESGEAPKGRNSTSCRVDRTDPIVRDMVERAACLVNMSPYNTEAIQVCGCIRVLWLL